MLHGEQSSAHGPALLTAGCEEDERPATCVPAGDDLAAEAAMRSMLVDAEAELDLDDGQFLDVALEAMVRKG